MHRAIAAVLVALVVFAASARAQEEPAWRFYPESGLTYTLLKGGSPHLRLEVIGWGPGWAWFSFGNGEVEAVPLGRTFTNTRKAGGTDSDIAMAHVASQVGADRIALDYELSAPAGVELTQVIVSLRLLGSAPRGSCTAVMADASEKEVALPFGRGAIGDAVRSLILTDPDGARIALEIDPPRPVSMDGDGRIQLAGNRLAAGERRPTRLTLVTPEPARFHATKEEAVQRDDTSNWFPYPTGPEGVPIDLSFLNKDAQGRYIPAGSHGFLTVQGDRFVFEDGTPARFWGLNVTAGAALGSPERAAQIAERLARLGVNVVRLHHLDSWANPIVDYDHPDGTTQHLNPESMRLLDSTIHELKRRGIYVVLDPWVQRCFKPADGVADYGHLGQRGNFNLHPYIYFDPRMQELIRKQWLDVWSHVNEFTGLAYRDDPAVVMTEVINEGLLTGLSGVTEPYYRAQVEELYRRWAAENDGRPLEEARIFDVNYGANNIRFMTWLHRRFYDQSHEFFRRIGVRIPINATNWAHFAWVAAAQTGLDFMDGHHYYGGNQIGPGHGMGGLWLNHPPGLPGGPFNKIAAFAMAGKPVASSECGNNPPKTYRAAYQVGLAAVAAFQGWDSVTGYAFSQSGRPRDTLSAFEWETDPVTLAGVALGALIYRRGDVSEARETVVMPVSREELHTLHWQDGGRRQYWNTTGFNATLEEHRLVVATPDVSTEGLQAAEVLETQEAFDYEPATTVLESDTGQLRRDWSLGVGAIDTPRTQIAYGKLGESGRTWETTDCTFDIETPFAVVGLSSLTGEPLSSSRWMLLTATARAENTGMAFNLAGTRVADRGEAPVIAEPVVGTITLQTTLPGLVMYPIAADGTRGPAVRLVATEGTVQIPLSAEAETVFYEITAE